MSPKDLPEIIDVLITAAGGDLRYSLVPGFQYLFGRFYPHALQILKRRIGGCLFEAPDKIAPAHIAAARQRLQRQRLFVILLEVLLNARNGLIRMLMLEPEYGERALRQIVDVDHKNFRGDDRFLVAAKFLYQVDHDALEGDRPPAGMQSPLPAHHSTSLQFPIAHYLP